MVDDRRLRRRQSPLLTAAVFGARVLATAFAAVRPSFEGLPFEWDQTDDYNGEPTDSDMLKFCYITSPQHPFVQTWFPRGGHPTGQTPESPFDAAPDQRFPE